MHLMLFVHLKFTRGVSTDILLVVINGCIRDVDEINGCDVGIRALNSHPMKSNKKGVGEKHVPVTFAGTRICDGEWLYADSDGILLSNSELTV